MLKWHQLLDLNNQCIIIAILFGVFPTASKTLDLPLFQTFQCSDPKTNQWTSFNISVDKETGHTTAKFWCLDDKYGDLNLHQTNNNNKDPDEKGVVLLCDSISKKWIGYLPLCLPTCVPPMGNNLEIELNQLPVRKDRFLMGTKAMFDCKDGHIFHLNDSSISRCGENGSFDRHPECVATCDENEIWAHKSPEMKVTFDQNKSSLKDRYLAGTVATFTCLESSSYIQGSSEIAICKSNGSWQMSKPLINLTCEPSCPGFPESNTVGLSITSELPPLPVGRYPLGKVQFNCADPHNNLIGNSHLNCIRKQQSAEWNGALPHCEASCFALHLTSLTSVQMTVSFDPPVLSGHSKVNMLNSRRGPNTTATFKCENVESNGVLYELVGNSKLTCQDGKWSSSQLPKCVATCNGSPVLKMNDVGNQVNVSFSRKESSLFPGRYLAGTEVIFTCFDSRFQLRGTSSSICDNNGSWTILTSPICVSTCEDFSSTSSGGVNVIYNTPEEMILNPTPEGRYPLNTTATFTCTDANYALIGNSSLVCKENHLMTLWDGNPPLCVKTCPEIKLSTNMEVTYYDNELHAASAISGRGYLSGTRAQFNCKEPGFLLMGPDKVDCLNDGSWKDLSEIQCVSSCREPHLSNSVSSTDVISFPSFTLSAQINSSGRYPVNTTVMYQCIKDGIHLKEKRILQCLPSGEWNDTILLCNSDTNSMANRQLIEYSVGLIIASCISVTLFIILVFCTLVILYIRHVRRPSSRPKWPSKKWLEFKRNNSQYETNEALSTSNDCEEQQRQCLLNRNSRFFTTTDGTDPAGYLVPIGPLNQNGNNIIDASSSTDSVGYLAPILTPVNLNSAAYFAAVTQAISSRSLTDLGPINRYQVNNNGSSAYYAVRPAISSRSLTDPAGYQIPIPAYLEENRRTLSTPLNYGENWDYHTYEEVV